MHQVEEIDHWNDLDGLAALICACDRIVSIDNVTIILVGALEKFIHFFRESPILALGI